jgi:hypothetical protein
VPGHLGEQSTQVDPNAVARIKLPADFVTRLNAILTPGATLLVSAEALYPQTSGREVQVVDADPPTQNHTAQTRGPKASDDLADLRGGAVRLPSVTPKFNFQR